jgi:hypothetical protein
VMMTPSRAPFSRRSSILTSIPYPQASACGSLHAL